MLKSEDGHDFNHHTAFFQLVSTSRTGADRVWWESPLGFWSVLTLAISKQQNGY